MAIPRLPNDITERMESFGLKQKVHLTCSGEWLAVDEASKVTVPVPESSAYAFQCLKCGQRHESVLIWARR